jgi:hypothetical protein
LQRIRVTPGPKESASQTLDVDDIANEIQDITLHVVQKIEQQPHPAIPRTEMNVRQPNRAMVFHRAL